MSVITWLASAKRRAWRPVGWALVAFAFVLYPFARTSATLPGIEAWKPSQTHASEVLHELLMNVYRSFELRQEDAIYDRLALSVTGDQLAQIYLQNRQSLELENRGGARANVDELDILAINVVSSSAYGRSG